MCGTAWRPRAAGGGGGACTCTGSGGACPAAAWSSAACRTWRRAPACRSRAACRRRAWLRSDRNARSRAFSDRCGAGCTSMAASAAPGRDAGHGLSRARAHPCSYARPAPGATPCTRPLACVHGQQAPLSLPPGSVPICAPWVGTRVRTARDGCWQGAGRSGTRRADLAGPTLRPLLPARVTVCSSRAGRLRVT